MFVSQYSEKLYSTLSGEYRQLLRMLPYVPLREAWVLEHPFRRARQGCVAVLGGGLRPRAGDHQIARPPLDVRPSSRCRSAFLVGGALERGLVATGAGAHWRRSPRSAVDSAAAPPAPARRWLERDARDLLALRDVARVPQPLMSTSHARPMRCNPSPPRSVAPRS